jgi:hypothetical protein
MVAILPANIRELHRRVEEDGDFQVWGREKKRVVD